MSRPRAVKPRREPCQLNLRRAVLSVRKAASARAAFLQRRVLFVSFALHRLARAGALRRFMTDERQFDEPNDGALGGSLRIESTVGQGTRARGSLPLRR